MNTYAWLIPSAIQLGVFVADCATKWLVRDRMYEGQSIALLPFLHLTYITNTGSAFGMGRGNNALFIGLTIAVLCAVVFMKRSIFFPTRVSMISYALIVGGAFGNLFDRVLFGRVTDFLDLRVWPVFNVADASISVGALIYLAELILRRKYVPNTHNDRSDQH